MATRRTIAVTIGEPAGIGPDLCVRLAERAWPGRLVLIGDIELLRDRARRLGAGVRFSPYSLGGSAAATTLEVAHFPVAAPVVPGRPDPANAKTVVATLEAALTGCTSGEFAAMVTAPVQKSVLNYAGIPFTGHTEFLAERTGTRRPVMMLVGGPPERMLRVALVTTHLPLSAVPAAITQPAIEEILQVVAADLASKFGVTQPRIAVCGLNPHAGEGGVLGREEIDIIAPAIKAAQAAGLDVVGPVPADTAYVPALLAELDCVVAMYHDQALPVVKHASFGRGVNITLGLPILRTSVDHGTALDLAMDDDKARRADPGSLFAAVELAIHLAQK